MPTATSDPKTEIELVRTFFHVTKSAKIISSGLFRALFTNTEPLPNRGIVFDAMQKMYLSGQPYSDIIALSKALDGVVSALEIVELVGVGSADEVLESAEKVLYRIEHLKELYFLRVSMNTSTRIAEFAAARDIQKILKASSRLEKVKRILFEREVTDYFSMAVDTINSPEEYIPAVFPKLRELIGGWSRKQLTAVGGKSGHNKTTFTLAEATESLKKGQTHKLLFITVDEPGEMIARRIIAKDMGISLKAMRDKKISLSKSDVAEAIAGLYGDSLIILDAPRSPEAIREAILDIAPDRAILDHIQDVNFPDNDGISVGGITYTLKLLKEAAVKTGANITVLSQVRDKVIDERFDDKVPRPHDFYYASTIRQKCREQCVVYWPYKDTQDEIELPFFDFIIWKSTYSETGKIKYFIDPDHAKFSEQEASKQIIQKKTEESIWSNL